ncbi:MAG: hypothetical protein AABZ77_06860, partial [Chloroflexota bacterium]
DFIGDSLRGTRGISTDMFKQPEKLLEVLDWVTPVMIQRGLTSARMGNAPIVGFRLHKGSDPFMSDDHFQTFYWPQWKKVMMAFINEGLIVRGGCQGFHNKRLETYRTMPKGKVYIFATSNIDRNAKAENVKAMIKTVKEYGAYS